jgi:hypothetical protein
VEAQQELVTPLEKIKLEKILSEEEIEKNIKNIKNILEKIFR